MPTIFHKGDGGSYDDAIVRSMSDVSRTDLALPQAERASPIARVPRTGDLPVERHLLLVDWNNTALDYPRDKCLHQIFETQVERTPDAIAFVFENERVT